MLPAWRAITSALTPTHVTTSHPGRPVTSATTGSSTAIVREATDALCDTKMATTNAAPQMSDTSGSNTTAPPLAVATPLPPRKLRVTGNTWPSTAAIQQANPSGRPPTAHPIPAGMAPLAKSARATTTPARLPAVR